MKKIIFYTALTIINLWGWWPFLFCFLPLETAMWLMGTTDRSIFAGMPFYFMFFTLPLSFIGTMITIGIYKWRK